MNVSNAIIEKIRKEGPISFRDYMDMCLYHPGTGYYTSPGDKIGTAGDFYTSPHFTSLFGEMIAVQLEEMWKWMGKRPFTIVEYGAGTGLLCRDILGVLQKNEGLFQQLTYYIIEKSPEMKAREKSILYPPVRWVDAIGDISPFEGCVLSNEVVDNFPVYQVVMDKGLKEIFVDYKIGFIEQAAPAAEDLKEYLEEADVSLPEGCRTEINLEALDWIRDIAGRLLKGFVLTIDYGYSTSEFYSLHKNTGTLTCYYKHTVNHCPYFHVGEQDITADVNFSALHRHGLSHGLENGGFTDQASFLMGLGLAGKLKELEAAGKSPYVGETGKARLLEIFLIDMGRRFKVLLQQKGLPGVRLSGMQFSQPLR